MNLQQIEHLKGMQIEETFVIDQKKSDLVLELKKLHFQGFSLVAAGEKTVVVYTGSKRGSSSKIREALSEKNPFSDLIVNGSISTVRTVASRFGLAEGRKLSVSSIPDVTDKVLVREDFAFYESIPETWLAMWEQYKTKLDLQFMASASEPVSVSFYSPDSPELIEAERLCWLSYDDRHGEHTAQTYASYIIEKGITTDREWALDAAKNRVELID